MSQALESTEYGAANLVIDTGMEQINWRKIPQHSKLGLSPLPLLVVAAGGDGGVWRGEGGGDFASFYINSRRTKFYFI